MSRRTVILRVVILTCLTALAAFPNAILMQGGFETGSLKGWTPFDTDNGSLGVAVPDAVTYSSDGVDTSYALQLRVGQAADSHNLADYQGGGVEQSVTTGGAGFTFSADVAVKGGDLANLSGG